MYILGVSAFYHDSAACLIKDGEIIAAAQEERFTRIKHDQAFPKNAIKFCIEQALISCDDIEYVVFYDKPFKKFDRLIETYVAFAPKGFFSFLKALPVWLTEKLFQKKYLIEELGKLFPSNQDWETKLFFSEHHLSHASSAFFCSPFKESAILTMDGVGEWTTTSVAIGKANKLSILEEIKFPHSLGLLYSAFTYYAGFKVNSGEYKLMGLAPYGIPKYADLIRNKLIDIKDDGSFFLNMKYFSYCTGLTMTSNYFDDLFGGPPRKPESKITQKEMDLAASIQSVIEDIIIKIALNIKRTTQQKNLCLAGGVALNCVANGRLLREKIFEGLWIQPAAGDAGGAVGAALAFYYLSLGKKRVVSKEDSMQGTFLGPEFSDESIQKILDNVGANYKKLSTAKLIEKTAKLISNGKVIGWHQGRMEFGPRALGNRSILADPRLISTQKQLNLKIKFRESFRPFAPSIIFNDSRKWFNLNVESPYMLLVDFVKENKRLKNDEDNKFFGIKKLQIQRSKVPAITHVDYSARIQTVTVKNNIKYYKLLKKFKELTNCPILVNTSFNIRGEPLVCSPLDSYKCFMGTNIDYLCIGNFILDKKTQKQRKIKYKHTFDLD